MYFSGFPAAMPQAKAGQVKVLALSSAKRSPIAPEIPTISEVTSIKDFDLTLWVGFFVPHGTPEAVIVRLNREINSVLSQPDVRAKLLDAGAVVTPLTIEATAGFMESQSKKYQQIIQETGVKID